MFNIKYCVPKQDKFIDLFSNSFKKEIPIKKNHNSPRHQTAIRYLPPETKANFRCRKIVTWIGSCSIKTSEIDDFERKSIYNIFVALSVTP